MLPSRMAERLSAAAGCGNEVEKERFESWPWIKAVLSLMIRPGQSKLAEHIVFSGHIGTTIKRGRQSLHGSCSTVLLWDNAYCQ
jgi:hypothetical protein